MRWNNPTLVCALLALSVGLASPALAQSDSRNGLRDRASSASGELSAELDRLCAAAAAAAAAVVYSWHLKVGQESAWIVAGSA